MRKNNASKTLLVIVIGLSGFFQFWTAWAEESPTIVINEVAYRGTNASTTDEWIELSNASPEQINLNGWQFHINSTVINLTGIINPHGFFLLERSDDQTLSDRAADQIFSASLNDAGAVLQLKNPSAVTVDQISQWYVDLSSPPLGFSNRSSMERISPLLSGDMPENWRINNQQIKDGLDAAGSTIFGTPGSYNSQTIYTFGYGYQAVGMIDPPTNPTVGQVRINELEILPQAGQKEWIEILNMSDQWLRLSGCRLHDFTGIIHSFTVSNSALSHERLLIELSSAKLADSGDVVELKCGEPGSEMSIDRVAYGNRSAGGAYVGLEGYEESAGYLPAPNGFNTLGRSPDGNTLWFLISRDDSPSKGQINPDLRPVPGVTNTRFVVGGNSVRLTWENPNDASVVGTKIFSKNSGTSHQFVLQSEVLISENSILLSGLPNEIIEFRLVSFNNTGKEAEGLQVSHVVANLLGLEISEVLPYPKSGLEFIEFHNRSNTVINLHEFELAIANGESDLNDPSGTFEFANFSLSPGEYFAFFLDPLIHSFRLSNITAVITLSDPDGVPVSEVDYLAPSPGVSIAYDQELQKTLFHPTPNAGNIFQNAPPRAVLTIQGTGKTMGCTVLDFNPTGADSYDSDEDELSFSWAYRAQSGQILFSSSEENPLSFKFTEDMGEFFSARLIVTDPFGASETVFIPLELQFCNGRKRIGPAAGSGGAAAPPTKTLYINEIYPNPAGSDTGIEFVELFNEGVDVVSLENWKLGGKTKKKLSGSINSKQYLVITNISLLNSANTIQLLDAFSNTVSKVDYPDPPEGKSYSRDLQGNFRWSVATPALPNEFPQFKAIIPDLAKVVKVVDGDTIDIQILPEGEDGHPRPTQRVRLIGVDTPETVHPFKPLEFFGKEASAYTKSQLEGKTVRLEYDLTKRDKYGRLLAYVFLDDLHFNAELIEKGYAFAYLRFPFKYREEFRQLEEKARKMGVGMWKSSEIQEIQTHQQEFFDEELEGMEILEEMLDELEKPEEEKKPEYDQTGWENIKLNEALPNPKGKDNLPGGDDGHPRLIHPLPPAGYEYLELINQGDTEVELKDWKIINNKQKNIYTFGEDIDPRLRGNGIMFLNALLVSLKNETETIQLIDPLGTIRDELSYNQKMKDDAVWSRHPLTNSWQVHANGTPGEGNKIIFIAFGEDQDRDGISDQDEISLGLDPALWDTNGDGFPDDYELLMQHQGLAAEVDSYQKYLTSFFQMNMRQTARTLTFSGESRPYTTVQLTIHSDPQTVEIPVGLDGVWSYKVEVGLEKGNHQAEAVAFDANGVKSSISPPMAFVLETRMNVKNLAKTSKAKVAKKKVKPLYQIVDQNIRFYDGEIASWDPLERILTLNNGKKIQFLPAQEKMGNIFLKIGERIRYSLENDQITVKNIQIIPSASANSGRIGSDSESWFIFLYLLISLIVCFCVGKKYGKNIRS